MGAWSAAILGNDTSCEVHERFIELYNLGVAPHSIAGQVLKEQAENLGLDKTNVWIGIALACWECKVLTQDIFLQVKAIIDSNEDIDFCKELDADESFIKERTKNLNAFLKKISVEKEKPLVIKKPAKPIESAYKAGMCLAYKNEDENYIGVYVTKSEHFRNRGEIAFCFLDFESKQLPEIKMFENGKLLGLKKLGNEWRFAEYCGNKTNINYDKFEKDDFYVSIPQIFTVIGELNIPDQNKVIFNFRWGAMDLKSPTSIISAMEKIRMENKNEHLLSEMTLGELLNKVGI